MHSNNIARIEKVAKGLGSINEEVVYVGGSVAEFYVIDSAKSDVRQTMDEVALIGDGHTISKTLSIYSTTTKTLLRNSRKQMTI